MNNLKELKCIVWDLDNTIWDGTLLESAQVTLKPGIRELLTELDERGVLHSIASKNNHADAMQKLKEFDLDHFFLYPQINWSAKSESIATIREKLNFGIDTFAFVDDQEFERDEVGSVHPEVELIDALDYLKVREMPRANPRFITSDSALRRSMYQNDIVRNELEADYVGPAEEFMASLEMEFVISEAKEEDLKRAEELTVRTNQLNATGRTYDYEDLVGFLNSDSHLLLICELKDKYGSYGKIGLALVEIQDEAWHLKLLLMSCRVISRGVGTVLLSYIMNSAKEAGKRLLSDFKVTDRNRMMYITYKFAGFEEIAKEEGYVVMENKLSDVQKYPEYMEITLPEFEKINV